MATSNILDTLPERVDVIVIGGGLIGTLILRFLSRFKIQVALLEKEIDLAMGVTKGNGGVVHPGHAVKPETLKGKLNARGCLMYDRICRELDVPFARPGMLMCALTDEQASELKVYYEYGLKNGVPGMELLNQEQVRAIEPNISPEVKAGLFLPSAGMVNPMTLTVALAENAVKNGAYVCRATEVISFRKERDRIAGVVTNRGEIKAKYVINAAGLFAEHIARMAHEEVNFKINFRKGEQWILDKEFGKLVYHHVYPLPTATTKGIVLCPTIDGNVYVGPNAHWVQDMEDVSTTKMGQEEVFREASRLIPEARSNMAITGYAGIRPVAHHEDFIIEPSPFVPNLLNVAGIQSPGLGAGPAIAEYAVRQLERMGCPLEEKPDFDPFRESIPHFVSLPHYDQNNLIFHDQSWGRVICRCENVTEAEIREAIRRPVGAKTVDGIKIRTRAGMGRCQGGFCRSRVLKILAEELGIPLEQVTKKGHGSEFVICGTKDLRRTEGLKNAV